MSRIFRAFITSQGRPLVGPWLLVAGRHFAVPIGDIARPGRSLKLVAPRIRGVVPRLAARLFPLFLLHLLFESALFSLFLLFGFGAGLLAIGPAAVSAIAGAEALPPASDAAVFPRPLRSAWLGPAGRRPIPGVPFSFAA
jgi:hypothetical protein